MTLYLISGRQIMRPNHLFDQYKINENNLLCITTACFAVICNAHLILVINRKIKCYNLHMDIQISKKINILRAIVMGANDGIISIAGVVFGVYGASMNTWTIFLAGLTATIAGTFSMATGEYVSVNSQLDSERSAKDEQRIALVNNFSQEAQFLIQHYQTDGISEENARLLAQQSMQKDALGETLHARYGINEDDFISPAEAAIASMMAFPLGAILPMVGMIFVPMTYRVVITLIFVIFALVLTGYFSAVYGNTPKKTMILRNVLMGLLTMSVTYLIGLLMAA